VESLAGFSPLFIGEAPVTQLVVSLFHAPSTGFSPLFIGEAPVTLPMFVTLIDGYDVSVPYSSGKLL